MTAPRQPGAWPGAWADPQGVAGVCLGVLLLAGTALPGLTRSGQPFPVVRVPPPQASHGGGVPGGMRATAVGATPARERLRTLGERGRPAPPRLLDINGADASALQTLPGVGPGLARRIVASRERHGPFRKPEDLLRVSGIGAKRYVRLRGLVHTAEAP